MTLTGAGMILAPGRIVWKRHCLQAFLFPRNPQRIVRERLVWILHPIHFSCSNASNIVAMRGDMVEGACGVQNVVLRQIISHGVVSARAVCIVAYEDPGSQSLKLERGS